MVIEPKVRGFICTTAHPDGCKENVKTQIDYIKETVSKIGGMKENGLKNVLVIGSSTGYGLSTRIATTYLYGAATLGIMFEKPASQRRTASPGYYNTQAFEQFAKEDGFYAKTLNMDAFSLEAKKEAISLIKEDMGKVDMIIYSLAAPRRTTSDGTTYNSTLKTTDTTFTNKSLDLRNNTIVEATIPPATEEEVQSTIKVMGGEDWKEWIIALNDANVLSENAITLAYSYIGPKLTYPVYFNGTIGNAKKHLYQSSFEITDMLKEKGIKAYVSVNKAVVTQASSAIPIVPLYFTILYKVMKEKGIHEGCIEQMARLFLEKLASETPITDEEKRIRLDDYEMREDVQNEVMDLWEQVTTENLTETTDSEGYWEDFYHMFGFHYPNVDYTRDIDLD